MSFEFARYRAGRFHQVVGGIAITGQVREPQLLLDSVGAFNEVFVGAQVVLATWPGEVERYPGLGTSLARLKVEIVYCSPPAVDTWGNAVRQRVLLEAGLNLFEEEQTVLKSRPDWVVSRNSLESIAAGLEVPVGPIATVVGLQRRIVVPWWNPQIPFRIGDEAYAGRVADLRIINSIDPLASMVCTHVGRFSVPFLVLPSYQIYRSAVIAPLARTEAAKRGSSRAYAVSNGLPVGRFWEIPHAPHTSVMRAASRFPGAQTALVDAALALSDCFQVVNPTPLQDQFIARVGGAWSGNGYTDERSVANPFRFDLAVVSYSDPRTVLERVAISDEGPVSQRIRAIESDVGAILRNPIDDQSAWRGVGRQRLQMAALQLSSPRKAFGRLRTYFANR